MNKIQVIITIIISIVTFIGGSLISGVTMYWKMRDRMELEIEEAITKELQLENRIGQVENKAEQNRVDIHYLREAK